MREVAPFGSISSESSRVKFVKGKFNVASARMSHANLRCSFYTAEPTVQCKNMRRKVVCDNLTVGHNSSRLTGLPFT